MLFSLIAPDVVNQLVKHAIVTSLGWLNSEVRKKRKIKMKSTFHNVGAFCDDIHSKAIETNTGVCNNNINLTSEVQYIPVIKCHIEARLKMLVLKLLDLLQFNKVVCLNNFYY